MNTLLFLLNSVCETEQAASLSHSEPHGYVIMMARWIDINA
jgi:hypothetical protein